ncbi:MULTISPECIES: hypothetical protein [unclassified Bradyrhizobium]|uniref:hypothetical protein n=1 Tax=unclassified Bradyrhizobium TaxID=2631580 RepID=UPI002479065A|nr:MULTISPECIES: hypothetical protein [unclassified Bradyrhizobium]WGS19160.1 hypothetical protein MTX22_32595 [Bradyrhizobium sp. ISRA463]WGS25997.1 hypothetical protein MTX19_30140 [Bradyrhizobium sp. ISRA464]
MGEFSQFVLVGVGDAASAIVCLAFCFAWLAKRSPLLAELSSFCFVPVACISPSKTFRTVTSVVGYAALWLDNILLLELKALALSPLAGNSSRPLWFCGLTQSIAILFGRPR